MRAQQKWFDRKFKFDLSIDEFPALVERLRETPERLVALCGSLPVQTLTRREGDTWTISENVGHLFDLEPIWAGRLDDFLNGAERLRPADLENRKTHEANHNESSINHLISEFRVIREQFVARLDDLNPDQVSLTALHPRLDQPMRVIDSVFFVAEHDDHHLDRINHLAQVFRKSR
ncbi:MAG: DinB family protein [Candidatus Zixiibacteriota bacterium]|nr:MAG: DinB family protein [candidate division Zixibacteria bacterium]